MIKELQNVAPEDLAALVQNKYVGMERFYTKIEFYKDRLIIIEINGNTTIYKGSFYLEANDDGTYDIYNENEDIVFSCPSWCTFIYYKDNDSYLM